MKLVNESTGKLLAFFYDKDGGYIGCGWIYPGGDPIEHASATEVQVEVGGSETEKDKGRIIYKRVPKDGTVIVSSSVEGGPGSARNLRRTQ